MVTSVSVYHAPILPLKKPYFTGSQGIERVKQLLRRNAQINKINRNGRNALTSHMTEANAPNKTMVLFLYAAGEKIDTRGSLPDYLLFKDLKLCLKHLCKEAIRKHLLKLDPQSHLFGRVQRLGLPKSLINYLLYGMSVDDEGE